MTPRRERDPVNAADLAEDRGVALAMFDLAPGTVDRLDRFVDLLLTWQRHTNFVAAASVASLWTRHVADSLQLLDLVPARGPRGPVIVDVGSGGGFPGVVLACALAGSPGAEVHLVESIGKKATFLREAVLETGAPGIVHAARLEQVMPGFLKKPVDYVTARAVARLPDLLELIAPLLKSGATAVLPKGQGLDEELTESTGRWHMEADTVPSRTNAAARILVVRTLTLRSVATHSSGAGKGTGSTRNPAARHVKVRHPRAKGLKVKEGK